MSVNGCHLLANDDNEAIYFSSSSNDSVLPGDIFSASFRLAAPLTPNSFLLSRDVTVKNVSIYAPWPAILYTESVKKGPFSTRKRERNLSQKRARENKSVTKYVCREETGRGRNPCVISYLSLSLSFAPSKWL